MLLLLILLHFRFIILICHFFLSSDTFSKTLKKSLEIHKFPEKPKVFLTKRPFRRISIYRVFTTFLNVTLFVTLLLIIVVVTLVSWLSCIFYFHTFITTSMYICTVLTSMYISSLYKCTVHDTIVSFYSREWANYLIADYLLIQELQGAYEQFSKVPHINLALSLPLCVHCHHSSVILHDLNLHTPL